jgi:hypothetical protein
VTNLPELTPRQGVSIYQKRWAIELVNWELKSGLGLGQHQVSGDLSTLFWTHHQAAFRMRS